MTARAGRIAAALCAAALVAACAGNGGGLLGGVPGVLRPATEGAGTGRLVGRDAEGVRREFGGPDFIRKENGAELWRYDGAQCALFVFFYDRMGALQVAHVETLPAGKGEAADPACLSSVRAQAGAPVS